MFEFILKLSCKMPPRKKIKTEKKNDIENQQLHVCSECAGQSSQPREDDQLQDDLCLTKFTFLQKLHAIHSRILSSILQKRMS